MAILSGIRVLDLARYVAGPMAAALLGDLGADVIRIEPPGGAEDRMPLPVQPGFHGGAGFIQTGRNKRGLTLDITKAEGRAILEHLLKTADIAIINSPPAATESLGLDFDSLRAIKPDIVFLHLTAFGSTGPYADRLGFDAIAQVMSGLPWLSGEAGKPMKSAAAWVDMASGFLGAFGVMAALRQRDATGEAQKVEANLLHTALTVSNYFLIEQALTGIERSGTGNRAPSGAPADLIQTRDGWIYVAVLGNAMFRRFAQLVGREELVDDLRFCSDEARAENGEALSEIAGIWSRETDSADALALLERHRIPAGPLLTPQQVLDDPHVRSQFIQNIPVPGLSDSIPYIRPPVSFGGETGEIAGAPPLPGTNSDEILVELGFSLNDIESLRSTGTI